MKKKGTALFMSPFEAEWQVVHMQRHKQIDVIYSTDSDCMLLGATEVIVDIGWGKEECLLFDFRNAAVECATEFKPYVDKLIEIGCFGGGASLVPLNDLPTGAEWSDLIGFCPFTELLPLRSPDFSLAASSNAGFRYSKDPNSINFVDPKFSDEESESLGIEKGRPLPIFARINFEKLPPLCCLHEDLLRHFINARQPGLKTNDFSRANLQLAVIKLKEAPLIHPDRAQSIISRWSTHEQVASIGQQWSENIWECIPRLKQIDDDDLMAHYESEMQYIFDRVQRLADGGSRDSKMHFSSRQRKSETNDSFSVWLRVVGEE
jgi:hypothetical protein